MGAAWVLSHTATDTRSRLMAAICTPGAGSGMALSFTNTQTSGEHARVMQTYIATCLHLRLCCVSNRCAGQRQVGCAGVRGDRN